MPRPDDKIGPYVLVRRLGQGGFGEVWLAENRTPLAVSRCALKLPLVEHPDLDEIRKEATLWERAKGHPNVLPIIEANIYEGQVVIVSEYAEEGTLQDRLDSWGGRAPDTAAAVGLTLGILGGLAHLHGRGILHRDLKPQNIMMQGDSPRIADFGLARVLASSAQTNRLSGTLAYMAPEAFKGERSERTDLWSVAVMLYQLLTGSLPFPYTDMTRLFAAIVSEPPQPLPGTFPQGLRDVLTTALAREPAGRYASAAAMREALSGAAGVFLSGLGSGFLPGIPGPAPSSHDGRTRRFDGPTPVGDTTLAPPPVLAGSGGATTVVGGRYLAGPFAGPGPAPATVAPPPPPLPSGYTTRSLENAAFGATLPMTPPVPFPPGGPFSPPPARRTAKRGSRVLPVFLITAAVLVMAAGIALLISSTAGEGAASTRSAESAPAEPVSATGLPLTSAAAVTPSDTPTQPAARSNPVKTRRPPPARSTRGPEAGKTGMEQEQDVISEGPFRIVISPTGSKPPPRGRGEGGKKHGGKR